MKLVRVRLILQATPIYGYVIPCSRNAAVERVQLTDVRRNERGGLSVSVQHSDGRESTFAQLGSEDELLTRFFDDPLCKGSRCYDPHEVQYKIKGIDLRAITK